MRVPEKALPILLGLLCAALVAVSLAAWRFRQHERELSLQVARLQKPQPAAAEYPPELPPEPAGEAELPAETLPGVAQDGRVAELEQQIADRDRMIAHLREAVRDAHAAPEQSPPARRGFGDYMKNLKTSDPERYAEIQERRRVFQERMEEGLAEQSSFFLDLDTSSMTEEQVTNHERLLELMDNTWELVAVMQSDPESDEAREARGTLHRNMRELGSLMDIERVAVLEDVAANIGYDEGGQAEFAEYINNVIDMTSMSGMFRRIHPRGEGAGMGRGGPPRSHE